MRHFQFTVRWMVISIAVIGLNLAAARAVSKQYPRRPVVPFRTIHTFGQSSIHRFGKFSIVNNEDGSTVYYKGDPRSKPQLHMLNPPNPTHLRIWSPVIASVTVSILTCTFIPIMMRQHPMTVQRLMFVAAVVALSIWLTVPAIRILCDAKGDHHVDWCAEVPSRKSFHVTPFWPRYWRLLWGRPWPGDYVCPLPHDASLPASAG